MALIKSGAIPCKNKKKKLISYLKSQYQALKFSKVQSLPTYKKLEEEWHVDLSKYEQGVKVYHKKFGEGVISSVEPENDDLKVDIQFEKFGHKRLMAKYANLEII